MNYPEYEVLTHLGSGISSEVFLIQDSNQYKYALKCFKPQFSKIYKEEITINKYLYNAQIQIKDTSIQSLMISFGICIMQLECKKGTLSPLQGLSNVVCLMSKLDDMKNPQIQRGIEQLRKDINQTNITIQYYILMRYMPNGELFDYIFKQQFPVNIARFYFNQILQQMVYMHKLGLVHLDLKLENILLDDQYNAIVSDFGFSTFCDSSTDRCLKQQCGTLGYICPEMLQYKPYNGKQADIFSLGVMLYILYTKTPPFLSAKLDDQNFIMLSKQQFRKFWDQKRITYPHLRYSEEFKDLFQQMTAVNPNDRPSLQQVLEHKWMTHNIADKSQVVQFMQDPYTFITNTEILSQTVTRSQKKSIYLQDY